MIPPLIIADHRTPAPNLADGGGAYVEYWRDAGGAIVAYSATVDGQHWIDMPGAARFRFEGTGGSVEAYPYPPAGPELVHDIYRRAVLPMVMQVRGTEVLHASAIVTDKGIVAFCGRSETGKSTIAFGLSLRGYTPWADDAVAMDMSEVPIRVIPLPFESRLRPAPAAFFPRAHYSQAVPSVQGAVDQGSRPRFPLVALGVLNRVAGRQDGVEIKRLPPASAFSSLLAHAYCFNLADPARKRRMVQRYADLSVRVPVFEVRFLTGLETLPATLDALEDAVIRPEASLSEAG